MASENSEWTINAGKTKLMIVSKTEQREDVVVKGEQIQKVEKHKYPSILVNEKKWLEGRQKIKNRTGEECHQSNEESAV